MLEQVWRLDRRLARGVGAARRKTIGDCHFNLETNIRNVLVWLLFSFVISLSLLLYFQVLL